MSPLDHADIPSYLRAWIATLPKKGHGAVNRLAGHLRVHSSFVSQVLSGTKKLSLEQAQELTYFLGLHGPEADYFLILAQAERAGTVKLLRYFETKLAETRTRAKKIGERLPQDRQLNDQERAVFYSSWVYSAVRLFASVGDGATLDEAAERFGLSRARAAEVLEFLRSTGLCEEKKGRFRMGAQRTHLAAGSPFLPRHHANWRMKAIQRSDDPGDDELLFTAPLSVSRKDFDALRERIMALIKEVSETVTKSDPDDVACLNIDYFWIRK